MSYSLNVDQKRIYDRVWDAVNNVQNAKSNRNSPLVLFVSGSAGTGKSVLIKELVKNVGEKDCIVCAPTGMAAKNIKGFTIHHALRLSPKSSKEDEIQKIVVRSSIQLLIVDEISMVGKTLFERVERRMQRIKACHSLPFGGCTVVLFGDLLQIPPVQEKWIFKSPLWNRLVQYDELTVIMRQQDDHKFTEMLQRWRIGEVTEEDAEILDNKAREVPRGQGYVSRYYCERYKPYNFDMILAYSNNTVDRLNEEILNMKFKSEQQVQIVDTVRITKKDVREVEVERRAKFKTSIEARVIITKNIDNNFVNGEMCVVEDFETVDRNVTKLSLLLTSSNTIKEYPINEEEIVCGDGTISWKTSYHMVPAFVSTYHRAQGQTLNNVYLFATDNLPAALFYVGASRVRTLTNLHVFNCGAIRGIRADEEALEEYKRLRVSAGMSPLP